MLGYRMLQWTTSRYCAHTAAVSLSSSCDSKNQWPMIRSFSATVGRSHRRRKRVARDQEIYPRHGRAVVEAAFANSLVVASQFHTFSDLHVSSVAQHVGCAASESQSGITSKLNTSDRGKP